jgi:hypothetical protein
MKARAREWAVALAALGALVLPAGASAAHDWPRLPAGSSFEWQLVAPWQTRTKADVYDIDMLEAIPSRQRVHVPGFGSYTLSRGENAGAIDRLHANGRKVVTSTPVPGSHIGQTQSSSPARFWAATPAGGVSAGSTFATKRGSGSRR